MKPGQAVRKGQTLISGQERTGGGETRACRAQGEIIARCFARGEARVRLNVTGTVETGEIRRRVRIESPKGSRLVRDAPDFDQMCIRDRAQPDQLRKGLRPLPRAARLRAGGDGGRGALA